MAAHRFVRRAIGTTKVAPVEVVTDRAATYPMVLEELLPARVIIAGHAFVQNLRRGHYELAAEEPVNRRVAIALAELAVAI